MGRTVFDQAKLPQHPSFRMSGKLEDTRGLDLDSWLKENKLEEIGGKLKEDELTLDDLLQCAVQEIRLFN